MHELRSHLSAQHAYTPSGTLPPTNSSEQNSLAASASHGTAASTLGVSRTAASILCLSRTGEEEELQLLGWASHEQGRASAPRLLHVGFTSSHEPATWASAPWLHTNREKTLHLGVFMLPRTSQQKPHEEEAMGESTRPAKTKKRRTSSCVSHAGRKKTLTGKPGRREASVHEASRCWLRTKESQPLFLLSAFFFSRTRETKGGGD